MHIKYSANPLSDGVLSYNPSLKFVHGKNKVVVLFIMTGFTLTYCLRDVENGFKFWNVLGSTSTNMKQ